MVKKKVLEHLIDYLVDNKFDTFFLVTGGAIVPTVDYIGRKEQHIIVFNMNNQQQWQLKVSIEHRVKWV